MRRTFYGFRHSYGANMVDRFGHPIGYVACFATRAERDAWVDNGDDYSTNANYRETVTLRWLQAHGYGWVNRPGAQRMEDNGVQYAI